ncbi:hypothetical protein Acr_09g0007680 [Actinidia rufa]|uniref:Uncharacterized protein n=1 Tax=Actinidia rufa TaxID=165716 RepID=A0A7J0F6I1_9ERIC|nr:hypothetical protein Acr_09g0007680 [Actinidia rufa]
MILGGVCEIKPIQSEPSAADQDFKLKIREPGTADREFKPVVVKIRASKPTVKIAWVPWYWTPHLFGHAMYFVMETFQIWNLASVGHGRCSIIQGAASTWSGRSNGPCPWNHGEIPGRMSMERYLGDIGDIIGKDCHLERFWWRLIRPSILPRLRAMRRFHFGSGRSDEYSEGGCGELDGDDLVRSRGLVLPRSREFGDSLAF